MSYYSREILPGIWAIQEFQYGPLTISGIEIDELQVDTTFNLSAVDIPMEVKPNTETITVKFTYTKRI